MKRPSSSYKGLYFYDVETIQAHPNPSHNEPLECTTIFHKLINQYQTFLVVIPNMFMKFQNANPICLTSVHFSYMYLSCGKVLIKSYRIHTYSPAQPFQSFW